MTTDCCFDTSSCKYPPDVPLFGISLGYLCLAISFAAAGAWRACRAGRTPCIAKKCKVNHYELDKF